MEKTLTISVASYNVEKYLSECLDSFVNTKVIDDLEIIVVNDGSVDDTLKIAKQYEALYPESIIVIDKENGGHGSTINASIGKARGKYYKVVDSDDWVDKDGIEKLVDFLKKNDADLILNPYYKISPDKKNKSIVNCMLYDSNILNIGKVTYVNDYYSNLNVAMHAFTFRTELLNKMNERLDENCFYVDVEYTIFPLAIVNTIVELDYPVYMYRFGTAEQSMNIKNMVKRMAQHYKVLIRTLNYYQKNKDSMNNVISKVVYRRLLDVVSMQYAITFAIPNADRSYLHYERFDKFLKNKYPDFYRDVIQLEDNRGMALVKVLRMYKNSKSIYGIVQRPLALMLNNGVIKIK